MLCSKAKNSFSVIIAGYVNIDLTDHDQSCNW